MTRYDRTPLRGTLPLPMRIRGSALLALAVAVAGGCADTVEVREGLGAAPSNIGLGEVDLDGLYKFAAKLSGPDGSCTGILITPGIILTASHCVYGWHNKLKPAGFIAGAAQKDWDISLGADPQFPEIPAKHSYSIFRRGVTFNRDIATKLSASVDMTDKEGPSSDIALMRLDERIPLSAVTPMHLPLLGYPSCGEDPFAGINIGFGECVPEVDIVATGCIPDWRNSATTGPWEFEDEMPVPGLGYYPGTLEPVMQPLSGAVYSQYWSMIFPVFAPEYPYSYHGNLKGDSGGPLITEAEFFWVKEGSDTLLPNTVGNPGGHALCGVSSRDYPVTELDKFPLAVEWGADYAAVDGPNLAWLVNKVLNKPFPSGDAFIGECFSGNPLLRDVDHDDDLIPDACDPCPQYYDADYDLSEEPDYDSDGVPDRCDNCPSFYNPLVEHEVDGEWVRDQTDGDQDGYGDVCDLCRDSDDIVVPPDTVGIQPYTDYTCCVTDADCGPADCGNVDPEGLMAIPPPKCFPGDSRGNIIDELISDNFKYALCANHCDRVVDWDCDFKGELCDNCPEKANPGQSDADGDGVGDVCDNCTGGASNTPHPEDLNPPCPWFFPLVGDAFCQALNPNGVCLPPKSNTPPSDVGRCSLFGDQDDDGLGDACDNCELTANAQQKNCNVAQEIVDGLDYPYVGDACDRNPCTSLLVYPHQQSAQEFADHGWVEKVFSSPYLLPAWHEGEHYGPAFQLPIHAKAPLSTTGLRACPCNKLGPNGLPDALICQADGCAVNSLEYSMIGSDWSVPSTWPGPVQTQNPPNYKWPGAETTDQQMINPVPNDTTDGLLPQTTTSTSNTHWYVTPDIASFGDGGTQFSGVLWSHVTDVTWILGVPPQTAAQVYFHYANHFKGGIWGPLPASPVTVPPPYIVTIPLDVPPCDPLKGALPDVPVGVVSLHEARVGMRSVVGDFELSDVFSHSARLALADPSLQWVVASERNLGADALRFASVSIDGRTPGPVIKLQGDQMTTVLDGDRLSGLPPTSGPVASRARYGTAFSATEGSLFLAGGRNPGSNVLFGDVWRYDYLSATWTHMFLEGPHPETVLSMLYRAEEAALYLVDEIHPPGIPRARLLRVDLSTQTSKLLGQWPRTKKLDRVYLSSTEDGLILLVGSSSGAPGKFFGGAFHPDADLKQPLPLSFHGSGTVAVAPSLTAKGLTITVTQGAGVINLFTPILDLVEHPGNHTIASFL